MPAASRKRISRWLGRLARRCNRQDENLTGTELAAELPQTNRNPLTIRLPALFYGILEPVDLPALWDSGVWRGFFDATKPWPIRLRLLKRPRQSPGRQLLKLGWARSSSSRKALDCYRLANPAPAGETFLLALLMPILLANSSPISPKIRTVLILRPENILILVFAFFEIYSKV
jgi:hypothetical protein